MRRQAIRHIELSVVNWIDDYLTTLGYSSYTVQVAEEQSTRSGPTPLNPADEALILVNMSSEGGDAGLELGGGNREVILPLVVDILAAPPSRAKGITAELFDMFAGRTTDGFVPYYDYSSGMSTPDLVDDERVAVEDVSSGPVSETRGDWYQIGANLVRTYIPTGY
jgi:hypothetical protein